MPLPPGVTGGAGSSPAGAVLAGEAPYVFTLPAPPPSLPPALFYDASTRSLTTPIDPVDQQVQMLLTIEQGAVPALGQVGQRYRQRFLGQPQSKLQAIALDETKVALAALLKAQLITIRSVTVKSAQGGSNVVVVAYTNLSTTPPSQPPSINVPA